MPVRRAVAAVCGAACDVNDAPAGIACLPVQYRPPAQVGAGGEVDLHGPVPAFDPISIRCFDRIGFENSRVVDKNIETPVKVVQRPPPKQARRFRIVQIAITAGKGHHIGSAGIEYSGDSCADATRSARYDDFCFHDRCFSQRSKNFNRR